VSITIDVLNLGDITGDWSFTVRGRMPGTAVTVPANAFLIRGAGERPVLVDAGTRNAEVLTRIGMIPIEDPETTLEAQLARFDLEPADIGCVIQTHLHADHAGRLDAFGMQTPVIVNRRELMFAFSGIQGLFYAPEDLAHVLERMYTPGALGILDLELSGAVEVLPGIRCEAALGHTDGSMNVLVQTDEGVACLCGDVVYEVQDQLCSPVWQIHHAEPQTSGNHSTSTLQEHAAIKRALCSARFLFPSHDRMGAVIECGRVVGRVDRRLPGPVLPLDAAPSLKAG
jgi:glyoxylase-like metal-dependent hydrolase (beta-lactamase superfamily II)